MTSEGQKSAQPPLYTVEKLIEQARHLAAEYRKTTGRPLPGVSVEIAHHDAVTLLGLKPAPSPDAGYDAEGQGDREGLRFQVKSRVIYDDKKSGQRLGQLKMDKAWDIVTLVLYDPEFQPFEIYEADRSEIEESVEQGSASRAKRGAMSVARFKNIGTLVWTREDGLLDDGVWQNR